MATESIARKYARFKPRIIAFLEAGGLIGTYTDEQARDAAGGAMRGANGLGVTVNDAGNTITVGVDDPELLRETLDLVGEIAMSHMGKPTASQLLMRYHAARGGIITDGVASSSTPPTADYTLTVRRNGTGIGTISWAAGATTGTVAISPGAYSADDIITITAPATVDATFADASVTLAVTR